jgi:hypothetical protein
MRVKVLFAAAMVAVCLVASSSPAAGQQGASATSPVLVKQLVAAMAARQLDAIAASDPDDAGRLIGALIVGDQFMVISSFHKASDYLELQLTKKQFRDVYLSLQDGTADGRLFFHDLGCDGFGVGDLDIFYEGAKGRTMLDGNWMAQGLTEVEYAQKKGTAEEKYVHALTVLLEAVKKLPIIT